MKFAEMKKVVIIGSSASGKSTLARKLSVLLRLDVIHLDALYWQPGWVRTPLAEWSGVLADLVQQDRWVIEGNYLETLDIQLAAADTIIFLDLPRSLCLWRAIKRRVTYLGRSRSDAAPNCFDYLSWHLLRTIWLYPDVKRPLVLQQVTQTASDKQVIILRQPAEVYQFLEGIAYHSLSFSHILNGSPCLQGRFLRYC
ncbi:MAG: AAA family ATPase [Anaerolineae bacterium]|nr:AAA family ATPase [Anaerolineae bacterium]